MRTDLMPVRAPNLPARAKLGEIIGRAWWCRGKGDAYLSALRVWILPVMGASAASKYLGFSGRRAILLWIGVAVTSEVLSIALGWLERRIGATQANFAVSTETDPYKARSLALLEEIRDALHAGALTGNSGERPSRERIVKSPAGPLHPHHMRPS